jgi:modulator of FtsH protease HflK
MAKVDLGKAGKFLKPMTVVIVLGVILALVFGFTSFFVVDQTERGVVTTFGRYTYTAEPGLHFLAPFGIQRFYNVATEVVNVEQFGFKTEKASVVSSYDESVKPIVMLTGDLNIVQIEWIVQYKIVDPRAWLFNLQDRHQTIRDISQSAVNQLVGDASFAEITTSARVRIEGDALIMMNGMFKEFNLGINVIAVKFQNVEMPEAVKDAFSDVSNAKTDLIRLINEGKEAYNAVIPKAQGEAQQIVQQAEGYGLQRVNAAQGDVARFLAVYAEYRKAPEITRQRLYYEMVEEVFGPQSGTTLIDKKLGSFLPIKNLGPSGSSSSAATGAVQ